MIMNIKLKWNLNLEKESLEFKKLSTTMYNRNYGEFDYPSTSSAQPRKFQPDSLTYSYDEKVRFNQRADSTAADADGVQRSHTRDR